MDYVLHVKNVLLLIVTFGIQRCMTQDEGTLCPVASIKMKCKEYYSFDPSPQES